MKLYYCENNAKIMTEDEVFEDIATKLEVDEVIEHFQERDSNLLKKIFLEHPDVYINYATIAAKDYLEYIDDMGYIPVTITDDAREVIEDSEDE